MKINEIALTLPSRFGVGTCKGDSEGGKTGNTLGGGLEFITDSFHDVNFTKRFNKAENNFQFKRTNGCCFRSLFYYQKSNERSQNEISTIKK